MGRGTDQDHRRTNSVDLLLYRSPTAMRVRAGGRLHAANAHLLFKVVVGHLRRHAVPALEIDLTDVEEIDYIGVAAIQDCERYAQRHGVLFTLVGVPAAVQGQMNRLGARDLLPPSSRPRPRGHLATKPRMRPRPYGIRASDRSLP